MTVMNGTPPASPLIRMTRTLSAALFGKDEADPLHAHLESTSRTSTPRPTGPAARSSLHIVTNFTPTPVNTTQWDVSQLLAECCLESNEHASPNEEFILRHKTTGQEVMRLSKAEVDKMQQSYTSHRIATPLTARTPLNQIFVNGANYTPSIPQQTLEEVGEDEGSSLEAGDEDEADEVEEFDLSDDDEGILIPPLPPEPSIPSGQLSEEESEVQRTSAESHTEEDNAPPPSADASKASSPSDIVHPTESLDTRADRQQPSESAADIEKGEGSVSHDVTEAASSSSTAISRSNAPPEENSLPATVESAPSPDPPSTPSSRELDALKSPSQTQTHSSGEDLQSDNTSSTETPSGCDFNSPSPGDGESPANANPNPNPQTQNDVVLAPIGDESQHSGTEHAKDPSSEDTPEPAVVEMSQTTVDTSDDEAPTTADVNPPLAGGNEGTLPSSKTDESRHSHADVHTSATAVNGTRSPTNLVNPPSPITRSMPRTDSSATEPTFPASATPATEGESSSGVRESGSGENESTEQIDNIPEPNQDGHAAPSDGAAPDRNVTHADSEIEATNGQVPAKSISSQTGAGATTEKISDVDNSDDSMDSIDVVKAGLGADTQSTVTPTPPITSDKSTDIRTSETSPSTLEQTSTSDHEGDSSAESLNPSSKNTDKSHEASEHYSPEKLGGLPTATSPSTSTDESSLESGDGTHSPENLINPSETGSFKGQTPITQPAVVDRHAANGTGNAETVSSEHSQASSSQQYSTSGGSTSSAHTESSHSTAKDMGLEKSSPDVDSTDTEIKITTPTEDTTQVSMPAERPLGDGHLPHSEPEPQDSKNGAEVPPMVAVVAQDTPDPTLEDGDSNIDPTSSFAHGSDVHSPVDISDQDQTNNPSNLHEESQAAEGKPDPQDASSNSKNNSEASTSSSAVLMTDDVLADELTPRDKKKKQSGFPVNRRRIEGKKKARWRKKGKSERAGRSHNANERQAAETALNGDEVSITTAVSATTSGGATPTIVAPLEPSVSNVTSGISPATSQRMDEVRHVNSLPDTHTTKSEGMAGKIDNPSLSSGTDVPTLVPAASNELQTTGALDDPATTKCNVGQSGISTSSSPSPSSSNLEPQAAKSIDAAQQGAEDRSQAPSPSSPSVTLESWRSSEHLPPSDTVQHSESPVLSQHSALPKSADTGEGQIHPPAPPMLSIPSTVSSVSKITDSYVDLVSHAVQNQPSVIRGKQHEARTEPSFDTNSIGENYTGNRSDTISHHSDQALDGASGLNSDDSSLDGQQADSDAGEPTSAVDDLSSDDYKPELLVPSDMTPFSLAGMGDLPSDVSLSEDEDNLIDLAELPQTSPTFVPWQFVDNTASRSGGACLITDDFRDNSEMQTRSTNISIHYHFTLPPPSHTSERFPVNEAEGDMLPHVNGSPSLSQEMSLDNLLDNTTLSQGTTVEPSALNMNEMAARIDHIPRPAFSSPIRIPFLEELLPLRFPSSLSDSVNRNIGSQLLATAPEQLHEALEANSAPPSSSGVVGEDHETSQQPTSHPIQMSGHVDEPVVHEHSDSGFTDTVDLPDECKRPEIGVQTDSREKTTVEEELRNEIRRLKHEVTSLRSENTALRLRSAFTAGSPSARSHNQRSPTSK